MFVYVIVNSETLKIYIGQHKGQNLQKYLQQKMSHAIRGQYAGRSYLYAAMRKYPKDVWSIHPLIVVQTVSECGYYERKLIEALNTQHPDVGYNLCHGGAGCSAALGCKHSPESIRRTLGGKNFSPEWRQHQSESHQGQRGTWRGKKFSASHRENLSRAHKAVPWSAARRAAQAHSKFANSERSIK